MTSLKPAELLNKGGNRSIDLSLQDGTLVIQQVILWVDRTFGVFHVVQGFGSKFNNPRHRCPLLGENRNVSCLRWVSRRVAIRELG